MSIQERPPVHRFYASSNGDLLIGHHALEQYVEAGGNPADIKPLQQAIKDPNFEAPQGISTRGWNLEDVSAFLHFYAQVLVDGTQMKPMMPTVQQLNDAKRYGLAPSRRMIHNITGGITHILDQTSLAPQNGRQQYLNMTRSDYLSVARDIHRRFGDFSKPIIDEAHRLGLCPNYGAFEARFRSASTIRELIGIGLDTRNWMVEDFIDWGVHVMTANDGWLPYIGTISQHIDANYRPAPKSIVRRFGSQSKFRKLVEQEYSSRVNAEALQRRELLVEFEKLSSIKAMNSEITDDQKINLVLAIKLFSSLGIFEGIQLDDLELTGDALLKKLQQRSGKGIAEIELVAEHVDAIELLYPQLKPNLTRLKLPENIRRGTSNYKTRER